MPNGAPNARARTGRPGPVSCGLTGLWLGVDVLDALDADAVRDWSVAAVSALDAHRAEIDELNVFPVADADTGTNLALTLRAGADALAAAPVSGAGAALGELARGAVLGARGNSGVIVAQLLRGLADAADGEVRIGRQRLRAGLATGVAQAYAAVADPVEGTILTVARAVVDGLPPDPTTLAEMVCAAVDAADAALCETTAQLPALAAAGVVDAGGLGLVVLLDALAGTVTGRPARPPQRSASTALRAQRESGSTEFEYEVQYLLDADDAGAGQLREQLAALGDSVVIAGTGDGTWNVHVHVNDVGAAIEAGVSAGATRRISVVRFDDHASSAAGPAAPAAPAGTAVVAIALSGGTAQLFAGAGVAVVHGTAGTPLVDDIAAAVRASGAAEVVLLPNAAQLTEVAAAAADRARAHGIRVTVVPTRSPVQGLAAAAVHDPARRFDDDVVAMAEAAAATRFAEVTIASEEALTSVGICQAGDVLGLIDGEVVEIGRSVVAVAFAIVGRLLGVGAELMTVLVGADAPPGVGDVVAGHVRTRSPLTEVTVYLGGQPEYPLIIGVE